MSTLTSKLVVDLVDGVSRPARGILGVMRQLRAGGDGFRQSQAMMAAPLGGVVRQLAMYGAAYFGVREGMRGTVGAAMGFESAFADVKKVIDASDGQFENMRRDILALSKDIPIAADGFAQIYAAAGQSGIANEELKGFAEATAKIATAWETPVDATGEALAKIKTALARDVKGTVALADAINHVGNVSAANSPDLLEYTNRVAAFAETAGFSAEQALAFGGAMIGSGFEPEVAATSFRNMSKALTMGTRATKSQRLAFKELGLDATKTAKGMQKNAVGTTLDVLDRIKKLPEWQQMSIAGALFGDEARALAPLFKNSTELRRLLGETGDSARYAGSAFEEYRRRAETTANTLERLKNNVAAIGIGLGDKWLPSINEGMFGILDVMATLGERATIFDQMGTAAKAFAQGLGYEGGIRDMVNDISDLLLGAPDGAQAADDLGRIFMRFREYGASVREFSDALRDNPLAQFLGEMSGYGFKLMLAAVGIGIFAGSVMKLAKAMLFLTGASTAWGILKGMGKVGGWMTGFPGGGQGGTAAPKTTPTAPIGGTTGWFKALGLSSLIGSWASLVQGLGDTPGDTFKEKETNQRKSREALQGLLGSIDWKGFLFGKAAEPGFDFREHMRVGSASSPPSIAPGKPAPTQDGSPKEVSILGTPPVSISGNPQVTITNPPPRPNINVSVSMTVNEASNGEALAREFGAKLRDAVSGVQADLEYSPGM